MANTVTYTKISDLSKGYRRSTTKLYRAYTKTVPEYEWADDFPDEDITPSGREMIIPLDVARGYGAHQADDAGYESRTETPPLQEGVFTFNHTNSRFAISLRAQALDRAAKGNYIISQIKYQSIKCIEAVMRKYAYMFYGFSTGVLCLNSGAQGAAASHVLTIGSGFGLSSVNNGTYLIGMFPVGEGVALIRSGALVTGAIGVVTATSASTPSVSVAWGLGVNVTPADGDQLVYANGVTGTTISETDYNKWNVGLFDVLNSASLHGLATSTAAAWASPLNDANGGSFGFVKTKKMRQALQNSGDTTLRRVIYANGVENDMQARERSALLWGDSNNMNLDANVKAKGVEFVTSRFTPPTYSFGLGADGFHKKLLTDRVPEDQTIDFGSLYKAEDRSALKGGVDIISANICPSRARTVAYGGLNEQ